ncbi:MAG: HAMP domain-containing protein [Deltaproteobacteria bacterium]|nr:HAMP domain-containing protein [Deltaproteobacteria bacterium]MBW2141160.1 HAMP domain-containing protein [Deltaproteobacteria bacterium]
MDAEKVITKEADLERKKTRLELGLIGFIVLAVIGLTILATNVVRLGPNIPLSNSILFFTVVNVNAILLVYLIFLVLRNLYRLFFAPPRELIGAKLRTKLVVAFISLSLGPTALLFLTALQFIATSENAWFNTNVEQSLTDSLKIGQYFMDLTKSNALDSGEKTRDSLEGGKLARLQSSGRLEAFLKKKQQEYKFSQVRIFSAAFKPIITVRASETSPNLIPPPSEDLLKNVTSFRETRTTIDSTERGNVIHVIMPIFTKGKSVSAVMAVSYFHPLNLSGELQAIARGLDGYRELKEFMDPIRLSHYLTLTLVTLLIIFAATWFGFRLAGGITGPIMNLAEGTQKIAGGDYDFTIDVQSSDEIGTLVASFNQMTRDLKASKTELTEKNIELTESYAELDQRRRYIQIVLQNVTAGVVSANADENITTINNSAEEILQVKKDQILGRKLQDLLPDDQKPIINSLLLTAQNSPRGSAETQSRINIGERFLSLHLHLTLLKDEHNQDMGMLIVFDDLTELEKAQRVAAWREVAQRIAHEVKNPLTPIQLSTQRLRKHYGDRLGGEDQIFNECTLMIIRQVEELKRLVDEFSNFARLPAAHPTLNDFTRIVEETLVLYKEGHQNVHFSLHKDPDLPAFKLDREQIKRALINLLDNAVAAVDNHGKIEISLTYDQVLKMIRLEVADDGAGISAHDKDRIFDPYFTTKKSGTGLGLTIVSTIIADHNGYIRVQDNQPRGTRFVIEMPVRA